MYEKHRISAFKALLESHKANSYHLIDTNGDFRLWQDLSNEGRLESIVRDAAFYDVPFEQFAEAARESLNDTAIEEAALRLAMRSGRELHDLEELFADDVRSEAPTSLVGHVRELLTAEFPEHENEEVVTREELTTLGNEIRADEAARKREDADWYGKEAFQKFLDGKTSAPAVEKGKDRDVAR
jgi:hypothetical protein